MTDGAPCSAGREAAFYARIRASPVGSPMGVVSWVAMLETIPKEKGLQSLSDMYKPTVAPESPTVVARRRLATFAGTLVHSTPCALGLFLVP